MKNITEDQLEVFHLPWNPTNMKSMKNQWIWYAGAFQTRERGHHLEVASPTSLSLLGLWGDPIPKRAIVIPKWQAEFPPQDTTQFETWLVPVQQGLSSHPWSMHLWIWDYNIHQYSRFTACISLKQQGFSLQNTKKQKKNGCDSPPTRGPFALLTFDSPL